ncbi:MAG: hypothetical protein EBX03_05445 [Rhodobacteraceae bacterium]|nr:hypothetical protein [Paracoccaceae bacterium]
MIIALIISSTVFFLTIYYLIFLKQKVPVEASKKFHLLGENLDEYLVRSEDSIPNLKKDLKKRIFWFHFYWRNSCFSFGIIKAWL